MSQFQKLGRHKKLIRSNFTKADYDIAFKKFTRESESNFMDFDGFMNAIEEVIAPNNTFEELNELITNIESVLM